MPLPEAMYISAFFMNEHPTTLMTTKIMVLLILADGKPALGQKNG